MRSTPVPAEFAIGEVAERFGLAPHVLRHWEDVGLLTPQRDSVGRRRFGEDEVVRIAAIIANQAAGLSLEQIRSLFDVEAEGRRELLEQHLADLDRRRLEIEVAREVTEHALHCTAHDVTTCPRFREATQALVAGLPVPEDQHPGAWRVTAGAGRRPPTRGTS